MHTFACNLLFFKFLYPPLIIIIVIIIIISSSNMSDWVTHKCYVSVCIRVCQYPVGKPRHTVECIRTDEWPITLCMSCHYNSSTVWLICASAEELSDVSLSSAASPLSPFCFDFCPTIYIHNELNVDVWYQCFDCWLCVTNGHWSVINKHISDILGICLSQVPHRPFGTRDPVTPTEPVA